MTNFQKTLTAITAGTIVLFTAAAYAHPHEGNEISQLQNINDSLHQEKADPQERHQFRLRHSNG